MGKWFNLKTHMLTYKSIPFGQLQVAAEKIWVIKAPEVENLQNKIKSRDAARKDDRTVKWVLDTLVS